ncbi:MAG: MoxR family ATPase [Desulfovermiculus sp.]|nr:MoxR family ATPase [Desulfovermiculus sp.]
MLNPLITQASQIIVDKQQQITLALTCLLAQGHVLIEDIPGIGKTTMAKTLATLLGLDFQRIQCTNDLLPGDILGVSVFDRHNGDFSFQPGPIFAQMVLVDEINRASPKTQSGLLEAMAEGQVSLDRQSHPLPVPFFVIATQNPLEQSGTSPLPESQLDRFMIRMHLGYPSRQAERNLLLGRDRQELLSSLQAMIDPQKIQDLQAQVQGIHTADPVIDYIQNILDFTRRDGRFQSGLSPRAGLDLVRCARAWALLQNRDFVLPEDVQAVLPWVTGHRLRLTEPVAAGSGNEYLMELFREVKI